MANDLLFVAGIRIVNIVHRGGTSGDLPSVNFDIYHEHIPVNTKFTDFICTARRTSGEGTVKVINTRKVSRSGTIIGGVSTIEMKGYGSIFATVQSLAPGSQVYDGVQVDFVAIADEVDQEEEIESPGIIYKESDDLMGYDMLFRLRTDDGKNASIPVAEIPEGETVYINWGDDTPDTVLEAGIPAHDQLSHNYPDINRENPYVNVRVKGNFSKFGRASLNSELRWGPGMSYYHCDPIYILGKFPSSLTHLGEILSSPFGWHKEARHYLPLPKDILANCENLLYLVNFFHGYDYPLSPEYLVNCTKLKNVSWLISPYTNISLPEELLKNNPEIESMYASFNREFYSYPNGLISAPPDLLSYTPKLKNISKILGQTTRFSDVRRVDTRNLKISLKDCPLIDNAKYAFEGYKEVDNYEKFFLYNPLLTAESLSQAFNWER